MKQEQKLLLEKCGWEIECESPFEIRHEDGSFATQQAAHMVLECLMQEETEGGIR